MKIVYRISIFAIALLFLNHCNRSSGLADASGTFEAEEVIISSEVQGKILEFSLREGQTLKAGERIGLIDSTQLYLTKKQLEAQINAVLSKKLDVEVQTSALKKQWDAAKREEQRVQNLVDGKAIPEKQLDDAKTQVQTFQKQLEAQKSTFKSLNEGIDKEVIALKWQIEQLENQLEKCVLLNPINGTVLTKYVQENEVALPGKALYKIADLRVLTLRMYVTGDQLPKIKLNQQLSVFTDSGEGDFIETKGTITWISDKAEFTPKTIQTKNERANKVYAVKVRVENAGQYKIGMYAETKFN